MQINHPKEAARRFLFIFYRTFEVGTSRNSFLHFAAMLVYVEVYSLDWYKTEDVDVLVFICLSIYVGQFHYSDFTFPELLFNPVEDSAGAFWLWLICIACWSAPTEVSRAVFTKLSNWSSHSAAFQKMCFTIGAPGFVFADTSVLNPLGCTRCCTRASPFHPLIKT